jgi:hypothetical protein
MAKAAPSALVSDVAGQFSGLVVVNQAGGLVIRRPGRFRRQMNPAQQAASARLRQASALWGGMSLEQALRWEHYARGRQRPNRLTGDLYAPSGFNAFVALATKALQVDPGAPVPLSPPATDYLGDPVTLGLVGEGLGSAPGPGGELTMAPVVRSRLAGALVVRASGPNEPGSVTELVLERLPNERRKPTGRMRSAAFHRFEPGSLELALEVGSGWWVVGYRFVRAATGQQTQALIIGRTLVE